MTSLSVKWLNHWRNRLIKLTSILSFKFIFIFTFKFRITCNVKNGCEAWLPSLLDFTSDWPQSQYLNSFDYIVDSSIGQLSELHWAVGTAREEPSVLVNIEVWNTHSYVTEYCVALVFALKRVERHWAPDWSQSPDLYATEREGKVSIDWGLQ